MVLTLFDGNISATGSEQDLFDITADKLFSTTVYTDKLENGDSVAVRVYVRDENDSQIMKKFIDVEISDAQGSPAFFVPHLPTKQYKVTIQTTGGVNRTFTWQRSEV